MPGRTFKERAQAKRSAANDAPQVEMALVEEPTAPAIGEAPADFSPEVRAIWERMRRDIPDLTTADAELVAMASRMQHEVEEGHATVMRLMGAAGTPGFDAAAWKAISAALDQTRRSLERVLLALRAPPGARRRVQTPAAVQVPGQPETPPPAGKLRLEAVPRKASDFASRPRVA